MTLVENGLTFPKAKIEPDNAGSNKQAAQKAEKSAAKSQNSHEITGKQID